MPSFKKLAVITGKTSAETAETAGTADTATEPKTIPPTIFQKRAGGKNCIMH